MKIINNIIKNRFLDKNKKTRHKRPYRHLNVSNQYMKWFNFYVHYNLDKIYFSNYYMRFKINNKSGNNDDVPYSLSIKPYLYNFDKNGNYFENEYFFE
jgi:hypothetical protein